MLVPMEIQMTSKRDESARNISKIIDADGLPEVGKINKQSFVEEQENS